MHRRLEPFEHGFSYDVYMVYVDIDEIDTLDARLRLFSRNRRNMFEFRDSDHCSLVPGNVRANVEEVLRREGYERPPQKIFLLTHLRTLGHLFNPVSFYFCFDDQGTPLCVIPEVGNTYDEQKIYHVGRNGLDAGRFRTIVPKLFYVSPFIPLDAAFRFNLRVPDDRLSLHIDDVLDGKTMFVSAVTGSRRSLTDASLLWEALRVPFVTLKVIGLIHLQAFLLWLKRLPYLRKAERQDLQQDIIPWHR
jgi:hypothetical protein